MKKFSIGDKVAHKFFGDGTVLEIDGVEKSCKLTIDFRGKISKKIMANFVKYA